MGFVLQKLIPVILTPMLLFAPFAVRAQSNDDIAAIQNLLQAYHAAIFGDLYLLNEEPFVTPRHLTRTTGNIVEMIGYPEYNDVLLAHAAYEINSIEVAGQTATATWLSRNRTPRLC